MVCVAAIGKIYHRFTTLGTYYSNIIVWIMMITAVTHSKPFSIRRPAVTEGSCCRITLAAICDLSCLTGFKIIHHKFLSILNVGYFLSIWRKLRSSSIYLVILEKRFFLNYSSVWEVNVLLSVKFCGVYIPYSFTF